MISEYPFKIVNMVWRHRHIVHEINLLYSLIVGLCKKPRWAGKIIPELDEPWKGLIFIIFIILIFQIHIIDFCLIFLVPIIIISSSFMNNKVKRWNTKTAMYQSLFRPRTKLLIIGLVWTTLKKLEHIFTVFSIYCILLDLDRDLMESWLPSPSPRPSPSHPSPSKERTRERSRHQDRTRLLQPREMMVWWVVNGRQKTNKQTNTPTKTKTKTKNKNKHTYKNIVFLKSTKYWCLGSWTEFSQAWEMRKSIRGFRICSPEVWLYLNFTGFHFAHYRSSIIKRPIQLYFMSHV